MFCTTIFPLSHHPSPPPPLYSIPPSLSPSSRSTSTPTLSPLSILPSLSLLYPYLIIRQSLILPHVLQKLKGLRENSHLVPVVGKVRGKENIPQAADMREKCLGPKNVRLLCCF